MDVLEAVEGRGGFSSHLHSLYSCTGVRDGSVTGNAVRESDFSDFSSIAPFMNSRGSIKDHSYLSLFYILKDVSFFLENLTDSIHTKTVSVEIKPLHRVMLP